MPDADISILNSFKLPPPYSQLSHDEILGILSDPAQISWRQEDIKIFGKIYAQPRLIAYYGDEQAQYHYSSIILKPLPWTDFLRALKRQVEQVTGEHFNAVFLNLYRDQNDSMGMHSDDEAELGQNPAIASLSYGASRTLIMKHRHEKSRTNIKIPLHSGNLLLMKGTTQHFWKHGINKEKTAHGPRVNLTFRRVFG
ncbi:hypothetical protein LPB140_00910 [Sphingorhabdus lutea]|uniref:Fe2OG dioxygenase domain-containing protein n=2 Tax=Sphingorhabdus lutea TaxID=1913578 RepID=A0A1L3JEB4_9SPHN|nr:hypothetical protein LPB140_00910 [Sphingorhabdus lutea]